METEENTVLNKEENVENQNEIVEPRNDSVVNVNPPAKVKKKFEEPNDLEIVDRLKIYDDEIQRAYIEDCTKYGVIPSGYFLRNMNSTILEMKHNALGAVGIKPICIALCKNTTITSLNFADNWLCDQSVLHLCMLMKENNNITELILQDNKIGDCFAEKLCDVLASAAQLVRLSLRGNLLTDNAAPYVADLMATSLRLADLDISHNNFGNISAGLFGRALPQATSICILDISWNQMQGTGIKQFGKGLGANKYLKRLNFSFNGLGPVSGLSDLANALKINTTLDELDISDNRIVAEGAVLLGKGLAQNSNLKVLKMGRNPMKTAGCFAILTACLKNVESPIREIDFQDIPVNNDFRDLQDAARIALPNLCVRLSTKASAAEQLHTPSTKPISMVEAMKQVALRTQCSLFTFLQTVDEAKNFKLVRQQFLRALEKYIQMVGLTITEEEMKALLIEADPGTKYEIDIRLFET